MATFVTATPSHEVHPNTLFPVQFVQHEVPKSDKFRKFALTKIAIAQKFTVTQNFHANKRKYFAESVETADINFVHWLLLLPPKLAAKAGKGVSSCKNSASMTIAEIKVDILRYVAATNDKTLLSEVLAYIHALRKNQDWWDELDETEVASIEEGNRQLERGAGIPHEEVRKKAKQILNK